MTPQKCVGLMLSAMAQVSVGASPSRSTLSRTRKALGKRVHKGQTAKAARRAISPARMRDWCARMKDEFEKANLLGDDNRFEAFRVQNGDETNLSALLLSNSAMEVMGAANSRQSKIAPL